MHPSIARLRELVSRHEGGDELDRWLAASLSTYLEGADKGLSLEEAFGVATAQGQPPWWRQEAHEKRDEAIRLVADHFGNIGITQQADEILKTANRYITTAWRRDRDRDEPPPEYAGTEREHLWKALQATGGKFPESPRHVRRILEESGT